MMEPLFGPMSDTWPWEEGRFAPSTNVVETDAALEVTAELPGLKPEEFKVEVHNGELWISGEKKEEKEEQGKTFHKVERRFGSFRRVVRLPEGFDKEAIDAEYRDGVLKITIPKKEEVQPKHIEVKT